VTIATRPSKEISATLLLLCVFEGFGRTCIVPIAASETDGGSPAVAHSHVRSARLQRMDRERRGIDALGLAASLAAVTGVAATGGLVTSRRLGWYRSLGKPPLTPPDGGFRPPRAPPLLDPAV